MKALAVLFAGWAGFASAAGGNPAAAFDLARAAYDEDRFDEAARIYEAMLAGGVESPSVRFNLGNARFRQGDTARAALEYRRAWRQSPRDPDIAANLNLALDRQGAPRPRDPHWTAWPLERIAPLEADRMAAAGWWFAFGLLAASFLARGISRKTALRRAAAAAAVVCAVGLLTLAQWRTRDAEHVVVGGGAGARFAPLENAGVHFPLPAGSIVDELERQGSWLKIRLSGKEGWAPRSILEPVAAGAGRSPAGS